MARHSQARKTWLAYLLCFPWGILGVHKFYLHLRCWTYCTFFYGRAVRCGLVG